MYLHIGNNIIISDKVCIGIFNINTLKQSENNKWLLKKISEDDKLICLKKNNKILKTKVSSFVVIKRKYLIKDELIWSKNND